MEKRHEDFPLGMVSENVARVMHDNKKETVEQALDRQAAKFIKDNPPTAPQGVGRIMYSIELRDLFAMQAMTTLITEKRLIDVRQLVTTSYNIADIMLQVREER